MGVAYHNLSGGAFLQNITSFRQNTIWSTENAHINYNENA